MSLISQNCCVTHFSGTDINIYVHRYFLWLFVTYDKYYFLKWQLYHHRLSHLMDYLKNGGVEKVYFSFVYFHKQLIKNVQQILKAY